MGDMELVEKVERKGEKTSRRRKKKKELSKNEIIIARLQFTFFNTVLAAGGIAVAVMSWTIAKKYDSCGKIIPKGPYCLNVAMGVSGALVSVFTVTTIVVLICTKWTTKPLAAICFSLMLCMLSASTVQRIMMVKFEEKTNQKISKHFANTTVSGAEATFDCCGTDLGADACFQQVLDTYHKLVTPNFLVTYAVGMLLLKKWSVLYMSGSKMLNWRRKLNAPKRPRRPASSQSS